MLLVSAVPPPYGGIATWTTKYLKYCNNHDVSCTLVNNALTGNRSAQVNRKRSLLDEIKRTIRVLKKLDHEIQKKRPTVIHLSTSCGNLGILRDYLCGMKAVKQGIPLILHCHCNVEDQITNSISRRFLIKLANMSSCVLVLNSASSKYMKSISSSDIKIMPNFIEQSLISSEHSISKKIKNVLFVGHVQPQKGVNEIFEVAKARCDLDFWIVGPVKDTFRDVIPPSNVTLLGSKSFEEVSAYYQKADVYLFPSHSEGFSVSLLEAMATGLPCIASDVGANRDMIESRGGVIVRSGQYEDILAALDAISSSSCREKISRWNLMKVQRCYQMDSVMNQMFSLYQDIL